MSDAKSRFDLDAAKAAVDAQATPQTGFFVFRPDDGPHLKAGLRETPSSAHAMQFRSELRDALSGEAAEKPAGDVYASQAPAPAEASQAASKAPKSEYSIVRPGEKAFAEPEQPKKKKMTVRRFLLGF